MDDRAWTVKEYCEREKVSRARLYKEWAEGGGPRWLQWL